MVATVTAAQSDGMAESLNSDIGTSHILILFTSGDVEVATMTYSAASGVVQSAANPATLTYAHGNYTDDAGAAGGTVGYAVIQTSGSAEMVRFSDPVNDIGLSSATITALDPVDVNVDIVIQMSNHT